MAASASSPYAPHTLHLLLPGLLWPARALQDMVFDLSLPALSWLLGRGRVEFAAAPDTLQWQAAVVGLPQLPVAALRIASQALEASDRWLCLDPIHLRVERTQLIVEDPAALQLSPAEAADLKADLAPLLAELGELHLGSAHEWHLHLHVASDIRTTPLPDAIGLNGDSLMPSASNVRLWRRLLNEVQMTLHEHPVNQARQARGLPPVNSLWPWGEGAFDVAAAPEWQVIHATGSQWQGLARHLGSEWQNAPHAYRPTAGKTLVLLNTLDTAARQRDAMQWRHAMQTLEQDWFAPLQQALQNGSLQQLVLHGQGAGQCLTATVKRSDCLRFWRRPVALNMLGIKETA